MKKQRITITRRQFNHLLSEVLAQSDEPEVNKHLSEDDFVSYILENALTPEESRQVERHLISCSECLVEMERLIEVTEAWRGPGGEQRLEKMRAEILHKISASLQSPDSPSASPFSMYRGMILLPDLAIYGERVGGALVATEEQVMDGALRWRIVEDEARNLIVQFSSNDTALSGMKLILIAGRWRRIITMVSVGPEYVSAQTEITRKEREQVRADTPLRLDFFMDTLYAESEG
jgi:hypothetical protein